MRPLAGDNKRRGALRRGQPRGVLYAMEDRHWMRGHKSAGAERENGPREREREVAIGCASSGCERWQQPSRPTSVRRPMRTIWREEQLTAVRRRQMNNSRRAGMGIKSAVQLSHRRAVSARARPTQHGEICGRVCRLPSTGQHGAWRASGRVRGRAFRPTTDAFLRAKAASTD